MYSFLVRIEMETPNQKWSLVDLATRDTPAGWESFFSKPKVIKELEVNDAALTEKEETYGSYLPLCKDVFNAYHAIDPRDVKVIIFGQDPYPEILIDGTPKATGMSFSVHHNTDITVSLRNIFKLAHNSFPNNISQFPVGEDEEPRPLRNYEHGDLTAWCNQGVMLLNSALTICPQEGSTHYHLWAGFLKYTVDYILEFNPKLITVLFGREAQKMTKFLQRTTIFTLPHPAARDQRNQKEFFESKLFAKINVKLIENGQTPIDWNLTSYEDVCSHHNQ